MPSLAGFPAVVNPFQPPAGCAYSYPLFVSSKRTYCVHALFRTCPRSWLHSAVPMCLPMQCINHLLSCLNCCLLQFNMSATGTSFNPCKSCNPSVLFPLWVNKKRSQTILNVINLFIDFSAFVFLNSIVQRLIVVVVIAVELLLILH